MMNHKFENMTNLQEQKYLEQVTAFMKVKDLEIRQFISEIAAQTKMMTEQEKHNFTLKTEISKLQKQLLDKDSQRK